MFVCQALHQTPNDPHKAGSIKCLRTAPETCNHPSLLSLKNPSSSTPVYSKPHKFSTLFVLSQQYVVASSPPPPLAMKHVRPSFLSTGDFYLNLTVLYIDTSIILLRLDSAREDPLPSRLKRAAPLLPPAISLLAPLPATPSLQVAATSRLRPC